MNGWDREDKRNLMNFLMRIIHLRDKVLLENYWGYLKQLNEEGKGVYEYEKVFRELEEKLAEKRGKEEMARNLLVKGIPADVIADSAGLSIEQVRSLAG